MSYRHPLATPRISQLMLTGHYRFPPPWALPVNGEG